MEYKIKAPAKINISLDVVGKRKDGYHDLRMVMQTVGLYDVLTFKTADSGGCSLTAARCPVPLDKSNLILRAASLLMDEFHISDGLKIHLEKNIPVAAGLAGGSSDAAASLIAVNEIFAIGLTEEELMKRAVRLGADVPYCVMQGTALAEGIGDVLSPLPAFDGAAVLIAKPPIDVSTAYVYKKLALAPGITHPDTDAVIKAMCGKNLALMGTLCANVLETVTIPDYPVIDAIKRTMLSHGARVSLMSGSGPSVFGIFESESLAREAVAPCLAITEGMFVTVTSTVGKSTGK